MMGMMGVVTLRGDLTSDSLTEVFNELKGALIKWGDVTMDITNVKNVDTAAIKMLIAAKKECDNGGKMLSFVVSDELRDRLSSVGVQIP